MSFQTALERQTNIKRIGKPTVAKLLKALPEADALALSKLFSDPQVFRDDLWRIIKEQASEYPELEPEMFNVSRDDVRKTCAEVRGL